MHKQLQIYIYIDKILYNNRNIFFFCKYLEKIKIKLLLLKIEKSYSKFIYIIFFTIFIKIDEISFLNNYRRVIILTLNYK